MIKAVTADQMREIDRRAIDDLGVPGLILMENAGLAVVQEIQHHFENLSNLKVTVFAGKGNNGGDGFVIARHLMNLGADPAVFLACSKGDVAGDAKVNLDILLAMDGRVKELTEPKHLKNFKLRFMHSTVIVDALLGTGLTSEPRGMYNHIIDIMNTVGRFTIAVDMPSGLSSDSGQVPGKCVNANATVTLGLPKIGLLTAPASNFAGCVTVADISLPSSIIEESACIAYMTEKEDIADILPDRAPDANKGSFGHLVLVCGSTRMRGAVALAGAGALRMGTGLVTSAGCEKVLDSVTISTPEIMAYPLAETISGSIAGESADDFINFAKDKSAVLLGCGLTTDDSTAQFVREVAPKLEIPLVIDADGLNCIGEHSDLIAERAAPTVITPHPGEMARLTGLTVAEIQAYRIKAAVDYSESTGCVVVLKGAGTVIAKPDGTMYINNTGNNGLATGGTGDVLAGMIAGLLAQGVLAGEAAIAAVYIHGHCADEYAKAHDTRSFLPTDILDLLPNILTQFSKS